MKQKFGISKSFRNTGISVDSSNLWMSVEQMDGKGTVIPSQDILKASERIRFNPSKTQIKE